MTDTPFVSVVVPTFDGRDHTLRLLDALGEQTLPADEFEVVVIVDGSEDGTKEALGELVTPFRLNWAWQPNRGTSAARNAGSARATGEVVVFLDDDIEPDPGFLEALADVQRNRTGVAALGAVHCIVDEHTPPFARYWAYRFGDFLAGIASKSTPLAWTEAYAGAMAVRRSDVTAAGGFEEAFDGYGLEDFEFALRLSGLGIAFELVTGAVAHHHYDKDFRTAAGESESRGRSAVIFASLHPEEDVDFAPKDLVPPSVARRLVRYLLPRMSLALPFVPGLVTDGVELAERHSRRPLGFTYTLGLEYFYLLGKEAALKDGRLTARKVAR
jgi:GT2 family glycosyltransferase